MKIKSMATKNRTTSYKVKALAKKYRYELLAAAIFFVCGLAGNMFYEDDVSQHNKSCASSTYSVDNPNEC